MDKIESETIARAREGDENAFGELVERYKEKVYFLAYRMTSNHSDADDIVQEAFIKAYRGLKRFRGGAGFYTWLYRITMNCCMDHLRRRKKRKFELHALSGDGVLNELEGDTRWGNPVREASLREFQNALADALEELSPRQRGVLIMHEFDGLPHGEIAKIMRCSEGTVRSRLHYARALMKKKLGKYR